jgi:hypothetical protein
VYPLAAEGRNAADTVALDGCKPRCARWLLKEGAAGNIVLARLAYQDGRHWQLKVQGLCRCLLWCRGLCHCLLCYRGLCRCLLWCRGLCHCLLWCRGMCRCLLWCRGLCHFLLLDEGAAGNL